MAVCVGTSNYLGKRNNNKINLATNTLILNRKQGKQDIRELSRALV